MNKAFISGYLRFKKHKVAYYSVFLLVGIILFSLFIPFLTPYPPNKIVGGFSEAPSLKHLLGTDQVGRDVFTRLFYGARVSLLVGFIIAILSTVVGVFLGLISGYYGGWLDILIMRITDIVMSFPYILLVLVSATVFTPGFLNIVLILGFVNWPGVARLVRGNVLSLKERNFILGAKLQGLPSHHILFSELLPNTLAPIFVYATTVVAFSMLDEAALSFLGMGIQPPQASLGNLLNGAQSLSILTNKPWMWVPAGTLIVLLVVSINFIGDALRDAFDPTNQ